MNGLKSLALSAAATLAISCTPKEKPIEKPLAPEISAQAQSTGNAAGEVLLPVLPKSETLAPTPLPSDETPETSIPSSEPPDTLSKKEISQVSKGVEDSLLFALQNAFGRKCKNPLFKATSVEQDIQPVTMLFKNERGAHVITNDMAMCGMDSGVTACGMIFNQHDGNENPNSGFIVYGACLPINTPKAVRKKLDHIGLKRHPDLTPAINKGNLRRKGEVI